MIELQINDFAHFLSCSDHLHSNNHGAAVENSYHTQHEVSAGTIKNYLMNNILNTS